MVIKKKSREELNNQTRCFLDHSENLWLITSDKKREILGALGTDSVDVSDKTELRSKLNWILLDKEFDWLYWEYVDYNKDEISKFRNFLKEVNIFPGYEFLSDDLALMLVRNWISFDSAKNDLMDNLDEFREVFKNNIIFLKEKFKVNDNDLWKFIIFIIESKIDDHDVVEKNLNIFKSLWINDAYDLAALSIVFCYDDCHDVIKLLAAAWINTADDFLKLEKLVRSRYYKNLKLFIDSWIKSADDLLKLSDYITLTRDENSEIIEAFKDMWVNTADDFLKLEPFILSPYFSGNIKFFIDIMNSKFLSENWDCLDEENKPSDLKKVITIHDVVDDFLKLKDLILHQRFSENQKSTISLLSNAWTVSYEDLLKLKNVIFWWNSQKVWLLINSWFNTVDSLLQLESLVTVRDFCYENIKLFIDAWIKSADDFLKLKPFYYDYTYDNVKLFIDLWIRSVDDFLKLSVLIRSWNSEIISILGDMWIKSVDEYLALWDICVDSKYKENLNILKWVKWLTLKNISDFKYIIINWYPKILQLFVDAWADNIEYFVKIKDNLNYWYIENVKYNIKSLKEFWIVNIDDLFELTDCIFSYHYIVSKKLEILKLAKVTSTTDVIKLSWYLSWKDFNNFLYELDKIYEKTGINFDDSLFEISNYVVWIWDKYWYWNSYELQRNILYLCYNKGFSLNDIESFDSLLISNPDVLLCVFNKFKDISLSELKPLEYVLRYSSVDCLTQIFKQYPDITFDELIELEDVLKVNESNLKIILEKYPEISQQGLLNLVDFLNRVNNDNLKIIFKKYPNIDITTLSWLTAILSNAYHKSFENILDCFEIDSTDLQKYRYLLLFNGKIPELVNLKEADHSWYLKYLNEVASTSYDVDKKSLMIQKILSLSFVEAENYLKIFKMFDDSISMDVQRIKNELIDEILKSEKPGMVANAINDIFERNNLPLTWKIFKVFELLYPKEKFKSTLQSHWSPVLHQYLDEWKNVYSLIYKDLMNIAIDSGDHSLKNYINTFIWCETLLKKFENIVNDQWFDSSNKSCLKWKLDEREQEQLLFLFRKCSVLYNRYYWKDIEEWDLIENNALWILNISDDQLVRFYNNIRDWFRLKKGESMYDRLKRFLWWMWYHSFEEVLDRMRDRKRIAHEHWLKLFNESDWWKINFPAHAFLKWVDVNAFSHVINRWITCREYLWWWEYWNAARSDWTPFDADWWYTDSFIEWGYGSVKLVVNTDKESIYDSREKWVEWYKSGKYELFKTWYLWENHYGIRTWIPTTEVDYVIYTWSFKLEKFKAMCYEIARNWYYIPITDKDWNIKFTPEMYHKIRAWFNFMEYYDWFDVELKDWKYVSCESDNWVNRFYNGTNEKIDNEELWKLIEENSPSNDKYKSFAKENWELARSTIERIKRILEEKCWVKFNSEYDSSITWAEIHDSGSTWRWTDIPTKDVDLDFTLLLDAKDYERVNEISKIIHKEIWTQKNDDHWVVEWWNQIKSKINNIWKSDERPNGVPLDLLILKKSQVIDYSSSDAMKEKLEYIKHNLWEKDFERVKTNVMIMKKLLKAKWCYKKPEWWISWIWVENWITQHHWSFIEALESFEQIAYWWDYAPWKNPISLKEFKEYYPIYDAWENYKDWWNDNFVYKLNQNWYEWTLEIIKLLRMEWIEWIRKIISDYENLKKDYIS